LNSHEYALLSSNELEKFVNLSVKERTYRIIKEKILNLEIEPGSRIREDLLANELAISRTPVREAINQLAAEGFVEIIPRKGVFSIELKTDDIIELLLVREALEVLAVKECIDKIEQHQIEELNELIDSFENAVNEKRYQDCNILDSEFHHMIAMITGNKKLIEFIDVIEDFMRIARNMETIYDGWNKNLTALKDHKLIVEAITKKDKKMAESAVRNNINNMKKNLNIYIDPDFE
jgi:DNA-binding GntR family transcriptional regulator